MPSPIAHVSISLILYRLLWRERSTGVPSRERIGMLIFVLLMSILPDIDSIAGILFGNFGKYHNQYTHSMLFAGVVFAVVYLVARAFKCLQTVRLATMAFVLVMIHLGMDWVTDGRGLKLLWPFTVERFRSPFLLFFGVKWSDGLFSTNHIITILNEVLVVGLVYLMVPWFMGLRRKSAASKTNGHGSV